MIKSKKSLQDAPKKEVRDIIRLFSPENTYKKQESVFNTHSKALIVETLVFLGDTQTNWSDYLKPACIQALIYRIQNLLPEECGVCKETYVVKKTDSRLLSCSICKQEVHHKCFQSILRNKDIMMEIYNTPGFHYLCVSCELSVIPQENCGLKKKKKKDLAKVSDIPKDNESQGGGMSERDRTSPIPTSGLSQNVNTIESFSHVRIEKQTQNVDRGHVNPEVIILTKNDKREEAAQSSHDHENGSENNNSCNQMNDNVKRSKEANNGSSRKSSKSTGNENVPKVCNHYRNNNCRHGIRGRGCAFSHPKRCSKLMKYGTKKNQGCNLGKNCPDFHPKMCPTSIAKLECLDHKCNLCHVKGTKRRREQNLNMSNQDTTSRKSSHPKASSLENLSPTGTRHRDDSTEPQCVETEETRQIQRTAEASISQRYFLDQINLLKKDFQEVVDQKIKSLFSSNPPLPQTMIQPYMVPPHQSMMFQLPLNHSQVPLLHRQF